MKPDAIHTIPFINGEKKKIIFFLLLVLLSLSCPAQFEVVEEYDTATVDVEEELSPEEEADEMAIRFDSIIASNFDPIELRTIPDSSIKNLKQQKDYWYADQAPAKKKKKATVREQTGEGWISTFLWIILIGGFLAFIIWFLATSNIRLFRKPSTAVETEYEEGPAEDIFEMDYDSAIDKAVATSDYRLAVRLMYLRTLKELSDSGLISYGHEKTNHEYLDELKDTRYYKDFFRLTRDFEYTWYGKFELKPEAFKMIREDFNQFREGLR